MDNSSSVQTFRVHVVLPWVRSFELLTRKMSPGSEVRSLGLKYSAPETISEFCRSRRNLSSRITHNRRLLGGKSLQPTLQYRKLLTIMCSDRRIAMTGSQPVNNILS